jgi:hypothetical protein
MAFTERPAAGAHIGHSALVPALEWVYAWQPPTVHTHRAGLRLRDLWHYLRGTREKYASSVAWYFRAIEQPDGQWVCRRGMTDYDSHADLEDAITHLLAMSADEQPAELFIHRLDGSVSRP